MALRLRELRQSKGVTQKKLADAIHTSTALVCRFETGTKDPSLRLLISMADYLGVSLDELVDREPVTEVTEV